MVFRGRPEMMRDGVDRRARIEPFDKRATTG